MGITSAKGYRIFSEFLENPNPQFLTKIHKVGLVWSAILIPTDRISKNTKFQTFIVVEDLKVGSWAQTGQPLLCENVPSKKSPNDKGVQFEIIKKTQIPEQVRAQGGEVLTSSQTVQRKCIEIPTSVNS